MTSRTERATKKRRREGAAAASPWSDLRLDALPAGPEKDRVLFAQKCFEAGDYAQVRTVADELAKSSSKEIQAAAAALKSRVGLDKVQVMLLAECALFLASVVLFPHHLGTVAIVAGAVLALQIVLQWFL